MDAIAPSILSAATIFFDVIYGTKARFTVRTFSNPNSDVKSSYFLRIIVCYNGVGYIILSVPKPFSAIFCQKL